MYLRYCLVLLAVLLLGSLLPAGAVTLVRDGKPAATIVLAKTPTRAAQFAAAELRWHVQKITGAELPLATDADKVTGTRILVGESAGTRTLGLRSADFKVQEYLIRYLPGALVLMGRDKQDFGTVDYAKLTGLPEVFDEQGTCYAVYDFLERACGVRWYMPGEFGLVYTPTATLTVGGASVRRKPAFSFRQGDYTPVYGLLKEGWNNPGGADLVLFKRRLRWGGSPYAANHSFYGYYDRFWEKNPGAPDSSNASTMNISPKASKAGRRKCALPTRASSTR